MLDQDQYDGFIMEVECNGGKLGGVPLQIFKESGQLKPEVATQIVQKLIEKEKVLSIAGIAFSIEIPGELGSNFMRQYQQAGLPGRIPLFPTGTVHDITLPALKETALISSRLPRIPTAPISS